ncbi:MAG: hypothetical protein CMJ16_07670 [Peredibacter sp.]|nr:hypothetical protein [Peredibacter sp.]
MKSVFEVVEAIPVERAAHFGQVETQLDPKKLIDTLRKRDELPAAYITYLSHLRSEDVPEKEKNTLGILQLYIFARNQFRGSPSKIKDWLRKGKLSAKHIKMSLLHGKVRSINQKREKYTKMQSEIKDFFELRKKGRKVKSRDEVNVHKKEMRLTDIETEIDKIENEITYILEKYQTLIAPKE